MTKIQVATLAAIALLTSLPLAAKADDPMPAPALGGGPGNVRPAAGPALGQWQIYRIEMSTPAPMPGNPVPRNAFYTILLDSATGETWILSPVEKDGKRRYVWSPIEREKEPRDVAADSEHSAPLARQSTP